MSAHDIIELLLLALIAWRVQGVRKNQVGLGVLLKNLYDAAKEELRR